jgi:hypothetical protein
MYEQRTSCVASLHHVSVAQFIGGYMSDNLYAPPNAHVADAVPGPPNHRHYYTPWQVCVATIIAGPLGGGYFASQDHKLFGTQKKASITMLVSSMLLIGLFALGVSLRKGESGTAMAGVVAGMYRWYAAEAFNSEISRRRAEGWTPASWWRVLGVSISIMVGILFCGSLLFLAFAKR